MMLKLYTIFISLSNIIKCYSNLTDGLAAYWNFDHVSNWKDPLYGGQPTVIGSGSPLRDSSIKKFGDGSLYVDGSSHLKIVSAGAWLPIGDSHYTISLWFRATSFYHPLYDAAGFIYWGTHQPKSCVGFRFDNNLGGLIDYWWGGGGEVSCSSTICKFSLYKWYHVASTYNGATKKLYVNGELKASIPASGKKTTSDKFFIGKSHGTEYFSGWLDDLYIYNRELDITEIHTLYSSSSSSIQSSNNNTLIATTRV